jgi:hypothetical protein
MADDKESSKGESAKLTLTSKAYGKGTVMKMGDRQVKVDVEGFLRISRVERCAR